VVIFNALSKVHFEQNPRRQRPLLNVLWISGIFALSKSTLAKRMKRLKSEVAVVDDLEQAWINKYRAAISEPPQRPIFNKIVDRLGYVLGIILGKSKWKLTATAQPKPQPLEEIGIKGIKRKSGSRKRKRGKCAA